MNARFEIRSVCSAAAGFGPIGGRFWAKTTLKTDILAQ